MAKISLQSQLAALDAVIHILRRYQLTPRSQAELLAEQLGPQRDHLSREIAEYNHAATAAGGGARSRERDRLRGAFK